MNTPGIKINHMKDDLDGKLDYSKMVKEREWPLELYINDELIQDTVTAKITTEGSPPKCCGSHSGPIKAYQRRMLFEKVNPKMFEKLNEYKQEMNVIKICVVNKNNYLTSKGFIVECGFTKEINHDASVSFEFIGTVENWER